MLQFLSQVPEAAAAVEVVVANFHIPCSLHGTSLDPALLEHIHRFRIQGHIHNMHHYAGFDQPEAKISIDEMN